MRANALKAMHAAGTPIVNGWLGIPSSYAAEIVAHAGYDAVTVDCQHGMIGFETAVAMLQSISTTPAVPMVRVSSGDPAQIMRYLDAGAYGIICPMISTAAQATALVSACRYQPAGTRSYGPARGLLYGGPDYALHANDEIVVLAMIETAAGLDAVEEIVATPGLDGLFVGPNDLALAFGAPVLSESDEPVMVDAIARIADAAHAAGKMAGIFCSGGPGAARRVSEGYDLVTPGNDTGLLRVAAAAAVAGARG